MTLETPRAERVCMRCDFSKRVGFELRCHCEPPKPFAIGYEPPTAEYPFPRPQIVGVNPPVPPMHSCGEWAEMQPDHPDFEVAGEVAPESLQDNSVPAPTHDVSREPQ